MNIDKSFMSSICTVIAIIGIITLLMSFGGNHYQRETNKTLPSVQVVDTIKQEEVVQPKKKRVGTKVIATIYNAVPEQCNSDPGHTAFMFKLDLSNPFKHKIIAVSRDLLEKYPKGTKVRVIGTDYDGIFTVMDKMNKRYTKRIDILVNLGMKGNKWDNVRIVKIN